MKLLPLVSGLACLAAPACSARIDGAASAADAAPANGPRDSQSDIRTDSRPLDASAKDAALASGGDFGNFRPQVQGKYQQISGGRGGALIHVTTLADTGTGSLRAAVANSDATIVFDVGGYIDIATALNINGSNLTIAGQTAPAPGVHLRFTGTSTQAGNMIVTNGTNVIIQHVAIRGQFPPCNSGVTTQKDDLILDHVSLSWQEDEGFDDWHGDHHLYWRVLNAEALARPAGSQNCEGGGTDDGHGHLTYTKDVSIMQSMFASINYRVPLMLGRTTSRVVNNLIYSFVTPPMFQNQIYSVPGNTAADAWYSSFVGNRLVPGPATQKSNMVLFLFDNALGTAAGANRIYRSDNTCESNSYVLSCQGEANELGYDPSVSSPPAQAAMTNITAMSSLVVEDFVLANAGSRPKTRNAIDARIVKYMKERQGPCAGCGLITSISDVGGFPSLTPKTSVWTDAASPNAVATNPFGDGFRTNREWKLEQEACALEPDCSPGPLP